MSKLLIGIIIAIILILTIQYFYPSFLPFNLSFNFDTSKPVEQFQARYRPISGPNIIMRPRLTPQGTIRQYGQTLYPAPAHDCNRQFYAWDNGPAWGISHTHSGTVSREANMMGCKEGKGYCCPCPQGVSEAKFASTMNGL
jgi:hypothetical protein